MLDTASSPAPQPRQPPFVENEIVLDSRSRELLQSAAAEPHYFGKVVLATVGRAPILALGGNNEHHGNILERAGDELFPGMRLFEKIEVLKAKLAPGVAAGGARFAWERERDQVIVTDTSLLFGDLKQDLFAEPTGTVIRRCLHEHINQSLAVGGSEWGRDSSLFDETAGKQLERPIPLSGSDMVYLARAIGFLAAGGDSDPNQERRLEHCATISAKLDALREAPAVIFVSSTDCKILQLALANDRFNADGAESTTLLSRKLDLAFK